LCSRRDRVDSILFIDRLPQHDAPTPIAPFQEIIEAAGADNIAGHAFNVAALGDRHFGLRNCVIADEFNRDPAEEMQDAHTAPPAFLTDTNELIGSPLKPGRHHAPIGIPYLPKSLPEASVTPDHPIFEQIAYLTVVFRLSC